MINGGKTKTILQKSKTVMKIPLLQKRRKNDEFMQERFKSNKRNIVYSSCCNGNLKKFLN